MHLASAREHKRKGEARESERIKKSKAIVRRLTRRVPVVDLEHKLVDDETLADRLRVVTAVALVLRLMARERADQHLE